LQELQSVRGYLAEDSMRELAAELDVPLSRLYSVATFFTAFRLKPLGRRHFQVCKGTACHVRGAESLTAGLARGLAVPEGETAADGSFSLESVRCLGCCGLAPVVKVNDAVHGRQSPARIARLVRSFEDEAHEDTVDH
jgi:NADH-quinone oxidoreductase subunit E